MSLHEIAPDPALRRSLEEAAAGLVYSSEGDHPFEFVFVSLSAEDARLTAEAVAALLGAPPHAAVREVELDDFFSHHIETSDPYDVRAQQIRPRYERLKTLLRESLRVVRVVRVGETSVRCYVVGRDTNGNLAGLATTAVET